MMRIISNNLVNSGEAQTVEELWVILSQASDNVSVEGATTIPGGSRAKWLEAPDISINPEMMIWSELHGNMQKVGANDSDRNNTDPVRKESDQLEILCDWYSNQSLDLSFHESPHYLFRGGEEQLT